MEMNLTISGKTRNFFRVFLMSLLLGILMLPAEAQNRVTVSGRLTDTGQNPLIGASVIEKGTTNGVTTDVDGRYSISVDGNATLDFSFIGYKAQSIAVMNRTQIDVVMEDDAMMIGEVVAIGYGSQRKEDLSMAVTTVKLDDVAKSRSSNLATMLQGRMPGVTIQQTGDPMKPASFSIRGRGSKGNDDDPTSGDGVLVVVDGVPNAPYMVEDVESITVLKDAASAAIYGASVGSSGVILITTKKAQSGQIRVSANVSLGFEKVSNLPTMLTAEQYNSVWAKAVESNPGSQLPSAADPSVYPWGNVTRTDWLDEIFQTGFTQHYAASISGGTEKVQSIFSLSYDKKEGVLLNTWSESFNGKLQTDFKLAKWLKISERASFVVSNGQGNVDTSHQGPIMGAVWYPRSATVYEMNEDGTYALDDKGNKFYGGTTPLWANVNGTPLLYNPVAYLERLHRLYPENKIYSTTSVEIKPISSLTIKSDFTADLRNKEADEFYPKMTERGLQRSENHREQFFYRDRHWLSETTSRMHRSSASITSAPWPVSPPTSRRRASVSSIRATTPRRPMTSCSGDRPRTGPTRTRRSSSTSMRWLRSLPVSAIRSTTATSWSAVSAATPRRSCPPPRTTTGSPRFPDRGRSPRRSSSRTRAWPRPSTWSSCVPAGDVSVTWTSIRTTWPTSSCSTTPTR